MLGSLFNKVAGLKVCNFFKKLTPTQVFPVDIGKILIVAFLYNTSGGCFRQSYHGTVKSAGCLFFDFAPPCTKTVSSLLELIGHVLLISKYILEKH